ncbi:MAG: 1-acyl-sn-glycerol-3-phosphate acyltransferase [Desulfovibrionaceae bacterium]|nr:1-acyl-sn-glycerol-3-phosphate acyltransferase [Desulfovibrionaceae bacterium]MBF0513529.1 1-acyl-sn-glycerol-3-phosphate acyltransferase [Desulfovibrionaceae bacterium]
MPRRFLFGLFFIPWTVLASSICWLLAGVGENSIVSHRLEVFWARAALWLAGVKVKADISALDPDANYAFLANHQSHFDILILFVALARYNIRFVAKRELFRIPVFGAALRRVGHISINRENRRAAMQSIDDAVAAARRGIGVLIFPEGTRSLDPSSLAEFKSGGMIMALKSGLPVAPIIVSGSYAVLPKGSLTPHKAQVTVTALQPFDPLARYTLKDRDAFRRDLFETMQRAYLEHTV